MNIQTNISFAQLTTMRLGGPARFYAEATTVDDLMSLYRNAKKLNQPAMVLGGGSNLIVRDEGFNGLVIHNAVKGFEIVADDDESTTVKVGGGESWDAFVEQVTTRGLSGIETLSAIPGTCGGAPVQNIGAYGQEIADTLVSVDAYDTQSDNLVQLSWEDCGFSYRHSIFRGDSAGRYAIIAITLKLYKKPLQQPFYAGLQKYLDENGISDYSPTSLRAAIIAIRAAKLPDPQVMPNSGSFFKNAIVEEWQHTDLSEKYEGMPAYRMDETHYKIPTGWLIEECGLKGEILHGIKVHSGNALVLINESATSYSDLAAARDEIITKVRDTFHITIEQEPLEI